jgi:hypothetical protein
MTITTWNVRGIVEKTEELHRYNKTNKTVYKKPLGLR